MNPTIEQELAAAKADLTKLQDDHKAQTDLLTEESNKLATALGEISHLTDQNSKLQEALTASGNELSTAKSRITELEASQKDFDTKVQTELARLAAATGTQKPANVTAGGTGAVTTITRADFNAMTPVAQANHFKSGGRVTD